ncbi:hypothetical protein Bhyg_04704 [Pseudolycoriella hygida]|uniref:Uncharacterized protein n=1 Tax=Pseudolycoriella hygida TaxID=35572 RepID=A0A9Q0NG44_9DIPT|nr:hypothetical protein Bhyg_04704 [Pseudolycoriella hygida]
MYGFGLLKFERKKKYIDKLKAEGKFENFKKKKVADELRRKAKIRAGLELLPKAARNKTIRSNLAYNSRKVAEHRQHKKLVSLPETTHNGNGSSIIEFRVNSQTVEQFLQIMKPLTTSTRQVTRSSAKEKFAGKGLTEKKSKKAQSMLRIHKTKAREVIDSTMSLVKMSSKNMKDVMKMQQPSNSDGIRSISVILDHRSSNDSAFEEADIVHPSNQIGRSVLLPDYQSPNNSVSQNLNFTVEGNFIESEEILPEYEPANNSVAEVSGRVTKRKKRNDRKWRKDITCQTEEEVLSIIRSEDIWSKLTKSSSNKGERVFYLCNKIKSKAKVQCDSGPCVLYNNDSASVTILRSANNHNHDDLIEKLFRPINEETGITIKNLLTEGYHRKEILNELFNRKLDVPSKTQLNNFIARVNDEKYGKSRIKLSELFKFLEGNSRVPEESNKPFVLDSTISDPDKTDILFGFFVSSKKLLENAIGKKLIAVDST